MRIPKYLPLILGLLAYCVPFRLAAADSTEQLFEKGNEAYSRGAYEEAVTYYNTILSSEGYSAPLLFNLGNSFARKGDIGKAVLNYKRALILAPSDPDIVGNLDKIRRESGLFQPEAGTVDRFFDLFTINQWALLALCSLTACSLFLLVAVKSAFSRSVHISVWLLSVTLLAFSSAGIYIRYQSLNPSVVIVQDAKLLISPFDSAASIGAIQEGRLLYPEKSHGDFLYVREKSGRIGWIDKNYIESIR